MLSIDVEVTPADGPGLFRVQARSPAGGADSVAPLGAAAILAHRADLERAILASSVSTRRMLGDAEKYVRNVGKILFDSLLGTGDVAGAYAAAAAMASERGEMLRVVLRIGDPALAGLPWEAMYDDRRAGYVCRQHQLVRYVALDSVAPRLAVIPPLRILGVVSSARGWPSLDTGKEKDLLEGALTRLTTRGLAEVEWSPSATWADLQDTLMSGCWHVLHFVGHGDFDPDRDEGVLALTGEDGRAEPVEASRLVDLLRQAQPMPRLVVLNSCSGAAAGVTDLFSGTAAALVRGGVSAVVAMQYEITDKAASAFARGFYSAISLGRSVDEAVSAGRVAIVGLSGRTLEWVTPVLYFRGADSRIYSMPESGPGAADDAGLAAAEVIPPRQAERSPSPSAGDKIANAPGRPEGQAGAFTHGEDDQETAAMPPAPPPAGDPVTEFAVQPSAGTGEEGPRQTDGEEQRWRPSRQFKIMTGHSTGVALTDFGVLSIAFSADGSLLASAAADSTVRLWDMDSGAVIRTLKGHTGAARCVAFSPDQSLVASGDERTVRLWNVSTGEIEHKLSGHSGWIRDVAFSPDGSQIASAANDRTVRVWDIRSGAMLHNLAGHASWVRSIAFSPDGRTLASSGDKAIRLWNTATWEVMRKTKPGTEVIRAIAFSPDGELMASGGEAHAIKIWNTASGELMRVIDTEAGWARTVAFDRTGTLLASGGGNRKLRVHHAATGELLSTLTGHSGWVHCAEFSPRDEILASGSGDATIRLWN